MTDERKLITEVMTVLVEGNDQPFLDAMHVDIKWRHGWVQVTYQEPSREKNIIIVTVGL